MMKGFLISLMMPGFNPCVTIASIKYFFDKYVNTKTTMKEFAEREAQGRYTG
jgi:hypothetical protein